MLTESRDIAVRLNVAQEVMRVAVSQQASFVEAAAERFEQARAEEADRVLDTKSADDFDAQAQSGQGDQEPQDGTGSLGISIDIEV